MIDCQISDEPPVTTRIHLNIPDILSRDHDVRLVPQRKHRHIRAHDLLNSRVQLLASLTVERVNRFLEQLVEFRVAITTAVARRSRL